MNNRVVFRAGKAAFGAGVAALRFNFRGVGASTGSFDDGVGEREDVTVATDWLAARYPSLQLSLVGFSFGAWVGLQAGSADDRIGAMIGLGLPINFYNFDFLMGSNKPMLFIAGTRDEFCPAARMERLAKRLRPAARLEWIEGADHFFTGQLDRVQSLIGGFLGEWAREGTTQISR